MKVLCAFFALLVACAFASHPIMEFHAREQDDIGKIIKGRLVREDKVPKVQLSLQELDSKTHIWRADYKVCFESMQHMYTSYLHFSFPGRVEDVHVNLCSSEYAGKKCWEQYTCKDGTQTCPNPQRDCIEINNVRFQWKSLRRDIAPTEFPLARIVTRDERFAIDLMPGPYVPPS